MLGPVNSSFNTHTHTQRWKERTKFTTLSSDLHMCVMACTSLHTHHNTYRIAISKIKTTDSISYYYHQPVKGKKTHWSWITSTMCQMCIIPAEERGTIVVFEDRLDCKIRFCFKLKQLKIINQSINNWHTRCSQTRSNLIFFLSFKNINIFTLFDKFKPE